MSPRKTTLATFVLLLASALTAGLYVLPRHAAAVQPPEGEAIAELKKSVAKLEAEVAEMHKALIHAGGIKIDSATDLKQIGEVVKLRTADLRQRSSNTQAILREVMGGKLVGQALQKKINDLNNDLAALWLKMASFGIGTDPYLDNVQLSDSGFGKASPPPDYGIPGPYVSLGGPRLLQRFLEASGVKDMVAEKKKTEFKKLVQAYSNPAVYRHRDFNERAYNDYRQGQGLFTPQYMADLMAIEQWLTSLDAVLGKQPAFFERH